MLLFDKSLFYFYLHSEDLKLLIDNWIVQFTVHHLKEGLELIVQLCFLDISIDEAQSAVLWVLFDRVMNEDYHELVPYLHYLLRVFLIL